MTAETTMETDESQKPYIPGPNAVDITPEKDGGVLKEIKQAGTGDETPPSGSSVYVHYIGTLTDGSKFDSSRDRGEKFEFTLGKGNVIKAWDLGVATMKRGEVAVLYCKSNYAYGESGSPPKIPPNATLVFEVELFDWKLEDISKKKDGGILRRTLQAGTGYTSPNEEALVEISLIGRHGDRIFDQRDLSFNLGEGSEHMIPEGVESALLKFKKQERSLLQLSPAYGFGNTGCAQLGIPSDASLTYEVELKNFEKAKETWSMDADEKLEQSKICKEKGTQHFKAAKYGMALKQYSKIIALLEHEKGLKEEKAQEREALLLASHLNQAMCSLKLNDFNSTKDHCLKALEMDPKNEKGLFRLGQALLGMHEPEEAKKHFEAILEVDSGNKAAANQVVICQAKIREQKQKDKQLYSSIFEKMAENDRKVSGSEKWRFGWWSGGGQVDLDVDLEKIDQEKREAEEEMKAARRKENAQFLKRYGGKNAPPKPLGPDGKPICLPDDDDDDVNQKSVKEQNDGHAGADPVGQQ